MNISPLAITPGEPAGIGPDLIIQLAQQPRTQPWVVIADKQLLIDRAKQLALPLTLHDFQPGSLPSTAPSQLSVFHTPLATPAIAGQLNPVNSPYVLQTLDHAVDGCLSQQFCAMVTGPVHKAVINEYGLPFTGHTDYLASRTQTDHVVMMLTNASMRVALATTHLPLSEVPAAITRSSLTRTIEVLHHDLQQKFGLSKPRILICGLNPHAGESGYMGREEIDVIEPVIQQLTRRGMTLIGPLPADTLFTPDTLKQGDAVLAMYHDQGLAPLKYAGFGKSINITLGLPITRTSVDHGTALTLAGSQQSDPSSLQHAINTAASIALNTSMANDQHSAPSNIPTIGIEDRHEP